MKTLCTISILCGALCLADSASARLWDSFLSGLASSKQSLKKEQFAGLYFTVPPSWNCTKEKESLECTTLVGSHIRFTKQVLPAPQSLGLVRLMRKLQWEKDGLKRYVESRLRTPLGEIIEQKARMLAYDNILSPVLISAFDVVIDKNCVSITTQCGNSECLELDKELNDLVSSFSKTPKK